MNPANGKRQKTALTNQDAGVIDPKTLRPPPPPPKLSEPKKPANNEPVGDARSFLSSLVTKQDLIEAHEAFREARKATWPQRGYCPGCGRYQLFEVPNTKVISQSFQTFMDQYYGKPKETHEISTRNLTGLAVTELTTEELEALVAESE